MRESALSKRAARDSLPLQDAFSVLFFVSVGMLLDPRVLVDNPGAVLTVVGIIVLGKSLAAIALVLLLRYPLNSALMIAASLAQIGEFSFILAGLGLSSSDSYRNWLSVSSLRVLLSRLHLTRLSSESSNRCAAGCLKHHPGEGAGSAARPHGRITDVYRSPSVGPRQVVIVGYGAIGKALADALVSRQIPFVVAEQNREVVQALRAVANIAAVYGDAAEPAVLIQAHIAEAAVLVDYRQRSDGYPQYGRFCPHTEPRHHHHGGCWKKCGNL